jgi:hypothetical protein
MHELCNEMWLGRGSVFLLTFAAMWESFFFMYHPQLINIKDKRGLKYILCEIKYQNISMKLMQYSAVQRIFDFPSNFYCNKLLYYEIHFNEEFGFMSGHYLIWNYFNRISVLNVMNLLHSGFT